MPDFFTRHSPALHFDTLHDGWLARPFPAAESEVRKSIPDYARTNFKTLIRAAADGNLALIECRDATTGELRYVICAVGWAANTIQKSKGRPGRV